MIRLYHGSNVSIDAIDLSKSQIAKDFGCGFYLTEDKTQAMKMAQNATSRLQFGEPIINTYLLDETVLSDGSLKVKRFDDYTEDWAQFIYQNRCNRSRIQCHNYDVVYGPVADDKVGVQLRRFMEGYIDIPTLIKELKFERRTFQYFFGTELAISKLQKI
ncbi:MAG: DUF3990 domain-containing protein [Bacteroidales bacterium]|nr:DUF3990 domain-containing protein [Bacteroidales bacterium]